MEDQMLASIKITPTISNVDLEKAKKARRLHQIYGHISSRKLKQMLKSDLLINLDSDITAAAIDNAKIHLGPCPGCLTNIKVRKPTSSQHPLTVSKGQSLHCDIMFVRVNGRGKLLPIHFSVDEKTLNIHGTILPFDFNGANIQEAQLKVIYYYKVLKCQVLTFNYDRDKVAAVSKDFLNSLGIELIQTSSGQHERIAEVMTYVVQEKVRATVFSIVYTIPTNLIGDLTLHVFDVINLMPNSKTSTPPYCVFRPEKHIDVNHLLKFGFGDIVMSANPKFQTGSSQRLPFNESKSQLGIVLRLDMQTPGGLIIFNLETKAKISRDGRYNTTRTSVTHELKTYIKNMDHTNIGTNKDIDIVDAKGTSLPLLNSFDNTFPSTTTKMAVIISKESPINKSDQREGLVIPVSNLSRDKISSNIRQRKTGQSDQDNPSIENLKTGIIMNNPVRERKSEQHNKICGSPNLTNSHGPLYSSPIDLDTKLYGEKQIKLNSAPNNQFLHKEIGLAEGERMIVSEHFPKENQSEQQLSNISEKRKFQSIEQESAVVNSFPDDSFNSSDRTDDKPPLRVSSRKKTPRVFQTMAFLCTMVSAEEEEKHHFLDNSEIHELCFLLDNADDTELDEIYHNIFNTSQSPIEFNEIDIENADIKELTNFITLETLMPVYFDMIPEHSKRKIIATHVLRRIKEKTAQKEASIKTRIAARGDQLDPNIYPNSSSSTVCLLIMQLLKRDQIWH